MSGDAQYANAAELRRVLRAFLNRSDKVVRAHGLTPRRYELLLLLRVAPPADATVTSLAASLEVGQSAATQLVQRAESDGLVERRLSQADARVHELRLSEEGERRLAAALAELGPERRKLLEALAPLALAAPDPPPGSARLARD